eukprot:scaffold89210_cov29-Tisochrysis_lutea.AAC.2
MPLHNLCSRRSGWTKGARLVSLVRKHKRNVTNAKRRTTGAPRQQDSYDGSSDLRRLVGDNGLCSVSCSTSTSTSEARKLRLRASSARE